MLTLVIVVLLIAIPGGYLVRSAFQSRDSGRQKQREAASTNLTYKWPTKVQRSVYDVPVPPAASRVASYETNSWKTNRLYVQFRTSDRRLAQFLADAGTDTSALRRGHGAVNDKRADEVGWDLHKRGHHYAGLRFRKAEGQPRLALTVDTTYKSRPRVYLVSTAKF